MNKLIFTIQIVALSIVIILSIIIIHNAHISNKALEQLDKCQVINSDMLIYVFNNQTEFDKASKEFDECMSIVGNYQKQYWLVK
jgi:hypothetical protein